MTIDESKFFREATLPICGSLEIEARFIGVKFGLKVLTLCRGGVGEAENMMASE